MSFLVLNQQNLELTVRVGLLETYKPTRDIKKAYKNLEKAKEQFKKKAMEITGKDTQHEINEVLETNEDKMNKFQEYLRNDFNELVLKIMGDIKEINKKICPGYAEQLQKVEEAQAQQAN